jgi:glycerol-3-phosphate acyltransferase PlsY
VSFKERLLEIEAIALCVMRKWWRPVTCLWIAGTMAVHGVISPLYLLFTKGEAPSDMTGLSLLVTAVAAAFAVREWGKIKGAGND